MQSPKHISLNNKDLLFPTQIAQMLDRIQQIDPMEYATSRNYKNGVVMHAQTPTRCMEFVANPVLPWTHWPLRVQANGWRSQEWMFPTMASFPYYKSISSPRGPSRFPLICGFTMPVLRGLRNKMPATLPGCWTPNPWPEFPWTECDSPLNSTRWVLFV